MHMQQARATNGHETTSASDGQDGQSLAEPDIRSFNLSTTVGMVLWEAIRQRHLALRACTDDRQSCSQEQAASRSREQAAGLWHWGDLKLRPDGHAWSHKDVHV